MSDQCLVICGIGLGNMICVTPLVRHLSNHMDVDVLAIRLNDRGSIELFRRLRVVRKAMTDPKRVGGGYDYVVNTFAVANRNFVDLARRVGARKYVQTASRRHQDSISEAEWNMCAVNQLGVPWPKPFTRTWAPRSGKTYGPFGIGFHAGCVKGPFWKRKKWTGFRLLAEMYPGTRIAMVGSKKEGPGPEWPKNVRDVTGLSLAETASVCAACRVFVSNDSGVMHLAAAVGTRTIGIFGGTSERKAISPGSGIVPIIARGLACRPCRHHEPTWKRCKDWKCMTGITPDMVKREVDRCPA